MQTKAPTKLTTVLLASTIMAGTMVLPEATHGAQQRLEAAKRLREQAATQAVAEEKVKAGAIHGAVVTDLTKHKDALADLTATLATPAAPGNMMEAITNAVAVGGSAAHALPIVTPANKIAVLEAIDGASGAGTDDVANSAVRTALGLDSTVPNFPATKAEVTRFIKLAKAEAVKTPARKATITRHATTIANVTKHKDALANPTGTLATPAAPGNMMEAITNAVAVGGSAAHALPIVTPANKIAVLEAIDGASGAGTDDVANSAVRTALGLDSTVPNFPATKAEVTAFINAAKALAGVPGADIGAQLEDIRTRLRGATHQAAGINAGNLAAGGNVNDSIGTSLTRLGM